MRIKIKNILFLIIGIILTIFFIFIFFAKSEKNINPSTDQNTNNIVNNTEKIDKFNFGIINGGYEGIYIYDIDNKKIVKNIKTGSYVNKAELDGNYIYLVDKEGLKIYSIDKNYNVELLNSFNTYGDSLSLAKNGDYIYVADGNNGIVVFELDKNIYIRFLQHIRINGIVIELLKHGNYIFALGPKFGLKVYEIKEKMLKEITSYTSLISPSRIYIKDKTLFIKDDILGLYVYDLEDVLNNNEFNFLYKLNIQIGDISPLSRYDFYYTNSEGLKEYKNGKITSLYYKNYLRSNINYNEGKIYISNKEKGFEIYNIKDNKIIYDHNVLSYVNNFNIFDDGILVEDSNKVLFFDHNFNLKWSKKIEGKIKKFPDGLISYDESSITIIKKNEIITKKFDFKIKKVVTDNNNILIISNEGIYSYQEESLILKGDFIDFVKYEDSFYVADDNNLYKFDPLSKTIKKVFYSSNNINSIEIDEKNIFIMTDYGIQYLDKKYQPEKFFSYSAYPDNYIFKDDIFYMTIQNKVLIVNTKVENLYSEHEFKMPIVDIDVYNNKVYISHSAYGIEWFSLSNNLELIFEGNFLTFNANNFYL